MNEIYKSVLTLRKGGENGEKCFFTCGDMMISRQLHDSEEEAIKEIESADLETVSRMIVAVMNAVECMIKEAKEVEE